jgi:hypothetical protein
MTKEILAGCPVGTVMNGKYERMLKADGGV